MSNGTASAEAEAIHVYSYSDCSYRGSWEAAAGEGLENWKVLGGGEQVHHMLIISTETVTLKHLSSDCAGDFKLGAV